MFVGSLDYTPKIISESMASTSEYDIKSYIQRSKDQNDKLSRTATDHSFNGLKDINNGMKAAGKPIYIEPDMSELLKVIGE